MLFILLNIVRNGCTLFPFDCYFSPKTEPINYGWTPSFCREKQDSLDDNKKVKMKALRRKRFYAKLAVLNEK